MAFIDQYRAEHRKATFLDMLNQSMPYDSVDGNLLLMAMHGRKPIWAAWTSIWEVRDDPRLIAEANNRLIGVPEVVFDYDPEPNERKSAFCRRVLQEWRRMIRDGLLIMAAYTTGSRGFHIHVLIRGLVLKPLHRVRAIKQFLLEKYGADLMKASTKSMIALERAPHWKTGNPKKRITMRELEVAACPKLIV